MPDIFLDDPVYALGDLQMGVHESAAAGRLVSDPCVLAEAGFQSHHICDRDTTVVDLAQRCLEHSALAPSNADILIFATALTPNGNVGNADASAVSGDVRHLMDFPASHLQQRLGCIDGAVIGLNQQACTATLGALRVARGLLAAEPDLAEIVCVSADRFPEGAFYEQAYNLISDGAAGFRVSRNGGRYRVLACHQITNGALCQASDDESVGAYFTYTCRLIEETLQRAGLAIADIGWIVPQNMNRTAWTVMARLLGVELERVVCDSLAATGHVIAADNIINLRYLQDSGRLRSADRVLLTMAGYGMNWQATLLEVM